MKIALITLMIVLVASITAAITTFVYHKILVGNVVLDDMKYQDFVSLSLTALGLMLAVLGFFVAAASLIGWTTIESKLKEHSVNYFKEQLSQDGELRAELEKLFADIAYEGVQQFRPDGTSESGEANYHD